MLTDWISQDPTETLRELNLIPVPWGPQLLHWCGGGAENFLCSGSLAISSQRKLRIFQGAAKRGRRKEFDHFFRFRDSFGHFWSLFLRILSLFSSLFCQTPFAGLPLRQGASWGLKKSRDLLGSGKNRRRSLRELHDFGALRATPPSCIFNNWPFFT